MKRLRSLVPVALLVLPALARSAEIDGATLPLWWGVPFAGILLSIALMPLLAPIFWHHHYGKVAAAWGLAFLLPFALVFGGGAAGASLAHALLAEYLPFVILLTALFTVAGGIYIRGNLHGAPILNTAILAIGAVLASFMGTTGASMLLIRPLIRANDNRAHKAHVVVFFIFIVSNAGGSLTPLGDPPLFLGFLKGVDFFWTVSHILPEALFLVGMLLVLFFALDSWFFHTSGETAAPDPTPDTRGIGFDGKVNFAFLGAVVGLVLLSGFWKSSVVFTIAGTDVGLPGIVRDYQRAARNAIACGFDGVEIHGANGYLLDQFLKTGANQRSDDYGGNVKNRARLMLEVVRGVADEIGGERTGLRLSPVTPANDISDEHPQQTFDYLVHQLAPLDLAYIHLIVGATGGPREVEGRPFDYTSLHALYRKHGGQGAWMLNNGYTDKAGAQAALDAGADIVAFGRPYIANPDLVARLRQDAPLNTPDRATFYGGGAEGYTDYPTLPA